ncbi:MAG: hypothetical protein K2X87_32375, partial [Gemmataceae bacterium]|nr:hypothetical protein [Gemmataceae bacterium]
GTHAVRVVGHRLPAADLPPLVGPLGHLDQLLAVWEWRSGPTPWVVAAARDADTPFRRAVESDP